MFECEFIASAISSYSTSTNLMPEAPASRRIATLQQHIQPPHPATAMAYKSPITSHVLDTSRGCPAANMQVELQSLDADGQWNVVSGGRTNSDGRVASPLVPEGTQFLPGTFRMVFYTQQYFEANGVSEFFYPSVEIAFIVKRTDQHYHVPLLINPFGYSTYRGS